jgi:hypothetical protein
MLRGWPEADLFWWSCLPENDARFGQRVAGHACAAIPRKLIPQRRWTRERSALLEACWVPWACRHFAATLDRWKPDAVWVIPHIWSILPMAGVLPGSRWRYHVTVQDFADAHGQGAKFGEARCARMVAAAERLYREAATRDATSHPMIAELRRTAGAEAAQMLHAGIEPEEFERLAGGPAAGATDEIGIAYAGTILVEREFELFVRALERVRAGLGKPVRLHLFASHRYAGRAWFDPGWMVERGNLPEEALRDALAECAWGFAPMALEDSDPRYNRYSFPTKFITYLAAGLPVITLGHRASSVMQMALQHPVGVATDAATPEALGEVLLPALQDPNPGATFHGGIVRCAREEFDAARMRATLHGCLRGG